MSLDSAPAADVLDLASDIRRHRLADIAFANALFAEMGVSSAAGRIIDRFSTMNTHMLFDLERLPSVVKMSLGVIHDRMPCDQPSEAAAAMNANSHRRRNSRRVPMPEATREAARGYARERITMLERTLGMVKSPRLCRELKDWKRLAEILDRSAGAA